jgi:hexosaminidase
MTLVRSCALALLVCAASTSVARAAERPALVPQPSRVDWPACPGGGYPLDRPVRFPAAIDAGGFQIVDERWRALGIPGPVRSAAADVRLSAASGANRPPWSPAAYSVRVGPASIALGADDAERAFDALATLAQLPVRRGGRWMLPCVAIDDAPALRWRIVSDDISRGPFPTLRYLKERIRALAAFKINGWSPYMENVFFDPRYPYVASPNALTAAQLRELTLYARRFHVAVIPEQQTLAHMHETLKYEQFDDLAELPHGYLVSPNAPPTDAYLAPVLRAEAAAAAPAPFFALGADEPIDLGRGRTPRTPQVFAAHVTGLASIVARGSTRAVIWDDAIQQDPSILALLPKNVVIATFHYGAERSFTKYIDTVAHAGFAQLVSPGANNWNEIYADLDTAYDNEAQFIADGKAARVLGMFETVWHDDGESLFEATWSPVAFAAASAWQTEPVDRGGWHRAFARAFFGTDDPRYAADLDALAAVRTALRTPPQSDPPNYLFWSDPFDDRISARLRGVDIAGIRRRAETVMAQLAHARPPLHRNAAEVMRLAALRYDVLGRRAEIGVEARADYADARAHAGAHDDGIVYRGLNLAKYLCWELRDELTALEPLYARAWNYESTPPGLARVLVRYRSAEARALDAADRLNTVTREDYLRGGTLPPFARALGQAN